MLTSLSFTARAFLALVLMGLFYVLAVAVAFGLMSLPYLELVHFRNLHPIVLAIGIIGPIIIFSNIRPRLVRIKIIGHRVSSADQPTLFQEIERIAKATRQRLPDEVIIVPDLNAAVTQQGGLVGVGGKRIMILGLPLLALLTCEQFRAVLAHEFGHYHAGDTALGSWIYRARAAMVRTVEALLGRKRRITLLSLPFLLYTRMFLRLTLTVARHQEFVADRLAARIVGARPLIDALQVMQNMSKAFPLFWRDEYEPAIRAGTRPPLCEGLQKFTIAPDVANNLQRIVREELRKEYSSPYETHPPLHERINALQSAVSSEGETGNGPAINLIKNLPSLEFDVLAIVAGRRVVEKLKRVVWNEAGVLIYLPHCENLVRANRPALSGIVLDQVPGLVSQKLSFGQRFITTVTPEHAVTLASKTIVAAMTLLLVGKGWAVRAEPGEMAMLVRDGRCLEPAALVTALVSGKTSAEDWHKLCEELGLADVDLGTALKHDDQGGAKNRAVKRELSVF